MNFDDSWIPDNQNCCAAHCKPTDQLHKICQDPQEPTRRSSRNTSQDSQEHDWTGFGAFLKIQSEEQKQNPVSANTCQYLLSFVLTGWGRDSHEVWYHSNSWVQSQTKANHFGTALVLAGSTPVFRTFWMANVSSNPIIFHKNLLLKYVFPCFFSIASKNLTSKAAKIRSRTPTTTGSSLD